jgi:hypothetical protein
MKTCIYCGEPLETGASPCRQCGRTQLPAKRFNGIISISLIGIVILAALLYWSLSQLVWLPLARLIFYGVANILGLDYTMLELPNQSFTNAVWLIGGAVLYLPLITFLVIRFGVKHAVVAALVGPLPFAYMDAWTWAAPDKPGILQFIIVLLVSIAVGVLLHFLYFLVSARWPARAAVIQAWALQPARPRPTGIFGDKITPLPVTVASPIVEEYQEIELDVVPQNPPSQAIIEAPAASAPEPVAELVPVARVNESAPPKLAAGIAVDSVENTEAPTGQGLPVWVLVVGLAVLIIIGILLVSFALK